MQIKYSIHAEQMMKERKIEKIWVEEAIKFSDKTEKEFGKYYAKKKVRWFNYRSSI